MIEVTDIEGRRLYVTISGVKCEPVMRQARMPDIRKIKGKAYCLMLLGDIAKPRKEWVKLSRIRINRMSICG